MTRTAATTDAALLMGSSRLGEGPGRGVQAPAKPLQGTCNGRQDAATATAVLAQERERTGATREQDSRHFGSSR